MFSDSGEEFKPQTEEESSAIEEVEELEEVQRGRRKRRAATKVYRQDTVSIQNQQ